MESKRDVSPTMFVIWFLGMSWSFADAICESTYDTTFGCDMTYGNVIESFDKIASVTACTLICNENNKCLSVKYDKLKMVCKLNSERYPPLSTECPVMLRYAKIKKKSCKKLINQACTSNSECAVPNSQCFNKNCQCNPGYSYRYINESCLTSCEVYGPTFTTYFGYVLSGLNDKFIINIATGEACMQACTNQISYVCRSTDFDPARQWCYLSRNTAQTNPDKYYPSEQFYYFNRNCQ